MQVHVNTVMGKRVSDGGERMKATEELLRTNNKMHIAIMSMEEINYVYIRLLKMQYSQ